MRILQLIYEAPGSPYGFGGAGVRAQEIYSRLSDRHEITLLCLRYPGAADGVKDGLCYRYAGTESTSLSRSVLAYTLAAAGYVRSRGSSFDVIVENFLPSTPFFSRFLTKTPVVLQVQGVMERHARRKFGLFYGLPMAFVERFYPHLYSRFIFVSEVTRQKVLGERRIRDCFCPVIPNGIDRELLDVVPSEGDYILFLSRIDIYTKGLDLLVEAFRRIAGPRPDLRLLLAGYEFDRFESLVSRLPSPLRERVVYAGFVEGEQKRRLLAGARLFILPSRHESAPISVIEAAACGRAVLASDIPELGFVEREGIGRNFRAGSAEDLAGKIALLLDDAGLCEDLGRAGRAFAAARLWDGIASRFEEALEEVRGEGR